MKSTAKFSGKKEPWVVSDSEFRKEWRFEKRPGGWIIGTQIRAGEVIARTRFFYSKQQQHFFAKFTRASALDFYGERVPESRTGASAHSDSDYQAQFPGKVRKILVKEGESVVSGNPLLMVEAMKMEFAIKATSDGVVKKICVEENMILTPGQKLLDFTPLKSKG